MISTGSDDDRVLIEDAASPFVLCTYFRPPSVADSDHIEARFRALFAREERFVAIHDLRRLAIADAASRKRAAEVTESLAPLSRTWCAFAVMVLASPVVRGAMTAVRWVVKPPSPETYVATLEEAVVVAEREARAAGLPVPSASAGFLRMAVRRKAASE